MKPPVVVNMNDNFADCDVMIDRSSIFGNPYRAGRDGTRLEVIRKYEVHARRSLQILESIPDLTGQRLGCHCAPKPCHGDVLVKLWNEWKSLHE